MAKRIEGSTPRQDGFRMPGEFEEPVTETLDIPKEKK